MNKLLINLLFIFIVSWIIVSAVTWELDILAPTNGTTLTNRDVNYSINFSALDAEPHPDNAFNVTIYRNGTIISGPHNITNSTFFNQTTESVNGVFEWYYNITDNSSTYNVSDTFSYTLAEPITDTYAFELLAPGEFNIFTDASVNFSFVVNATGGFLGSSEQLSCDVMNRSSTTGAYSILFSNNITNSTFFNRTASLTNERHQWYVNCSNSFQPERNYGNSLERNFDINTNFFNLPIGLAEMFNISMDTGDLFTAGKIHAGGNVTIRGSNLTVGSATDATNMSYFSDDGTQFFCAVENDGTFSCVT